ncbi:hypothetical protein B5807_01463 [Epicoccum nigrum]|uniref:Uncharacterized protein n=1 Tax=Epicoccum nigrum TaxID=105696 RepID=A0A1Y2MIB4_EPING|nr:hypothetical protein B5807_01463 [Epicoccum nigrum]
MPTTATPRPRTGPADWRAPAPVAVAGATLPDAEPDAAERVALPEGVFVPEMAVTEAELDAEAAEAEDADADADADAEADAETPELTAPQSGLVLRVTPAPLQRVEAKSMVAGHHISHTPVNSFSGTYS